MADQLVLARLFEIEARLGEKSALLEGVVVADTSADIVYASRDAPILADLVGRVVVICIIQDAIEIGGITHRPRDAEV